MSAFLRLLFAVTLLTATTFAACGDSDEGSEEGGSSNSSSSNTDNNTASNSSSASNSSAQVSCDDVVSHIASCAPDIAADAEAACSGFSNTCRSCIVNASCQQLDSGTTCFSECNVTDNSNGTSSNGTPDTIDGLLSSCAALCIGDLTCVKSLDASSSDDGICTIQCGNDLDCTQLDGQAGVSDWTCEDVQGANTACVPFGW